MPVSAGLHSTAATDWLDYSRATRRIRLLLLDLGPEEFVAGLDLITAINLPHVVMLTRCRGPAPVAGFRGGYGQAGTDHSQGRGRLARRDGRGLEATASVTTVVDDPARRTTVNVAEVFLRSSAA